MNELRGRGLRNIQIAVIDGLKAFPEAIRSVFPETQVQMFTLHLRRHGLNLCVPRRTVAGQPAT